VSCHGLIASLHFISGAFSLGGRVLADLFVVLFQSSQIFTSFRELTFFHTFADIPLYEGTLGIHQVELGINAREDLSDSSRVGKHADGALDLGHLGARDDGGGLAVDAALEASWAPVDELNGGLLLDGRESGADILGEDVAAIHEAGGHILAELWLALAKSVLALEDGVGDFGNRVLLVEGLVGRDDRGVGRQQEVNARIGDQVGLELVQVHVERAFESQRAGERGDDLSNQSVQVSIGRARNVQSTMADVIDGFVVEQEGAISVLEERVGAEDGVVGLNDGGGDLRRRIDAEVELGLLAVVNRETLEQQRAEARASTTTDGVEDHEALETVALVSQLADAFKDQVDLLLADGVVTTSVIVGSIFFAADELLGMEELLVSAGADLVDDRGLQISHNCTRNIFASTSFLEEGLERAVLLGVGLSGLHGAVNINTVLGSVELPAGVTQLDTSLTNV